jgi:ATP-dependent Clp protease ATP-binding subunit ClpA
VILFIDEVHNLIGSGTVGKGNKGSGLDIANLLKPPLGRGELQVNAMSNCRQIDRISSFPSPMVTPAVCN